jgi:uncharacterized protein (DUF433 family)
MTTKFRDVKDLMRDLNAGMCDEAIMEKYDLSATGLKTLLKNLEQQGSLSLVSARDFIRDVRLGMSNLELMDKYKLSSKAMDSIFRQMEGAGISINKVRLSARGSANVIRMSEVASDIRSGLTKQELMEKYHVTLRGLLWIAMELIIAGALSGQEIYGKLYSSHGELASLTTRRSDRHKLNFYVPISSAAEPDIVGSIHDVSAQGLGTRGIIAAVGETRTLCILGDSFGEVGTTVLDGRCAWAGKDPMGVYRSGFEIKETSSAGMQELQLLIKLCTLGSNSNSNQRKDFPR